MLTKQTMGVTVIIRVIIPGSKVTVQEKVGRLKPPQPYGNIQAHFPFMVFTYCYTVTEILIFVMIFSLIKFKFCVIIQHVAS